MRTYEFIALKKQYDEQQRLLEATSGEKNKGSGAGYLAGQLGLGALGTLEGAAKAVLTPFYMGNKENLDKLYDSFSNTQKLSKGMYEWYNPSKGMQIAGDVASGIGQMVPAIALGAATGGAGWVTAGTIGLSATGNAFQTAYEKTGKMGGREIGYGLMVGGTELALEKLTGVAGKAASRIAGTSAKQVAKEVTRKGIIRTMISEGLGEAFEEGMSSILEPQYQKWLGIDKDAKVDWNEVGYSALIGGLTGGLMSGASTSIDSARMLSRGRTIAKDQAKLNGVVDMSKNLMDVSSQRKESTGLWTALKKTYAEYTTLAQKNSNSARAYMKLATLERLNTVLVFEPAIIKAKKDILDNAKNYTKRLNDMGYKVRDGMLVTDGKGANVTTQMLQKDGTLLTNAAVHSVIGNLMLTQEQVTDMMSSGQGVNNITQADWANAITSMSEEQIDLLSDVYNIDLRTASLSELQQAVSKISTKEAFETRLDKVVSKNAKKAQKTLDKKNTIANEQNVQLNTNSEITPNAISQASIDLTKDAKSETGIESKVITEADRDSDNSNPEEKRIKITSEMTETERYEALKDRTITVGQELTAEQQEAYNEKVETIKESGLSENLTNQQKREILRKLADEFKVIRNDESKKPYFNKDIELEFNFSKSNVRESLSKQKAPYSLYAEMLAQFDSVIENAVGIETHKRDNYKPDPTLENVYVLTSGFQKGESIVPVKLEVKQFSDKINTLYVAVTLKSIDIKKIGVWKQGDTTMGVTQNSRPINLSLAEFFQQINPKDTDLLKYVPKQFLTQEQIEAVEIAEAKEKAKLAEQKVNEQESKQAEITQGTTKPSLTQEVKSKPKKAEPKKPKVDNKLKTKADIRERLEGKGYALGLLDGFTDQELNDLFVNVDGKVVADMTPPALFRRIAKETDAKVRAQLIADAKVIAEARVRTRTSADSMNTNAEKQARRFIPDFDKLNNKDKLYILYAFRTAFYSKSKVPMEKVANIARLGLETGTLISFRDGLSMDLNKNTKGKKSKKGDMQPLNGVCIKNRGEQHIILDPTKEASLESVVVHELTHAIEGTKKYAEIVKRAESMLTKDEKTAIEKAYKEAHQKSTVPFTEEQLQQELTAHAVAKAIGSQEGIARLLDADKDLGKFSLNWIKEKLTQWKYGRTELGKLENLFRDAMSETLGKKYVETLEMQALLPKVNGFKKDKYYERLVDKVKETSIPKYIKVGYITEDSPIHKAGIPVGNLTIDVSKITMEIAKEGDSVLNDIIKKIPDILSDPVVITGYDKNTVNVFSDYKVGEKSPVMVGVMIAKGRVVGLTENKIRTAHARRDALNIINEGNIFYLNEDKKRTRSWFQAVSGNRGPEGGTLTLPFGGAVGFFNNLADFAKKINENKKGLTHVFNETNSPKTTSETTHTSHPNLNISQNDNNGNDTKQASIPIRGVEATSSIESVAKRTDNELGFKNKVLTKSPKRVREQKKLTTTAMVNFTNQQAGVERVARQLGKTKLEAESDTHFVRSARNGAMSALSPGGVQTDAYGNIIGRSIYDIMDDIGKKNRQDFGEYLSLLHNPARIEEGKPVRSESAEQSRELVAKLEEKHPQFKRLADEIHQFNKNRLQLEVDTGLRTQESADYLIETYPYYIPTYRDMPGHKKGSFFSRVQDGRHRLEVKTNQKKATGSDLNILPPWDVMGTQWLKSTTDGRLNMYLNDMYSMMLEKGDVAGEFEIVSVTEIDTSNNNDSDGWDNHHEFLGENLKKVKSDKETGGYNEVTFIHEGKYKVTAKVSTNVFRGLQGLANVDTGLMSIEAFQVMARGVDVFKKLVTSWNPLFFLYRNPVKDIGDMMLYTRYSLVDLAKTMPRALNEIVNNGKYWQEAKAAGIISSSVYNYDTSSIKLDQNFIQKGIGKVENVANVIEMLPRMTEYINARESGADIKTALYQAADVTTNFSRGGIFTKAMNRTLIPFLNPSVQGFAKMGRSFLMGEGGTSWLNLIMRALVLGIGAAALNDLLNDDEEEYQKLSTFVKESNYIICLGDGTMIKIPKGRVVSVFGSISLRSKEFFEEGADGEAFKKAFKGYGRFVANQVSPADTMSRNIFSPIHDIATNTTWYGGNIENMSDSNFRPSQRYDASTSKISIWLGKQLNYSPKRIDYLIDQYTGVIGDLFLPMMSDAATEGMLRKNFIADEVKSNKYVGQYYDTLEEYKYRKNEGDIATKVALKYANIYSDTISEMQKQQREIQASDKDKKDKLAEVRALQVLINATMEEVATMVPKIYENIKDYGNDENSLEAAYYDVLVMEKGPMFALEKYNKRIGEKAKLLEKANIDSLQYYYFQRDKRSDAYIGVSEDGKDNRNSRERIHRLIYDLDISEEDKLLLFMSEGYMPQDYEFSSKTASQAKILAVTTVKARVPASDRVAVLEMLGFKVEDGKVRIKGN